MFEVQISLIISNSHFNVVSMITLSANTRAFCCLFGTIHTERCFHITICCCFGRGAAGVRCLLWLSCLMKPLAVLGITQRCTHSLRTADRLCAPELISHYRPHTWRCGPGGTAGHASSSFTHRWEEVNSTD